MTRSFFALNALLTLGMLLLGPTTAAQGRDVWIFIDTGNRTLSVLQDSSIRRTYRNISIGRGGAGYEKRRQDGKTPLGDYHISRISGDTTFHRFFELDYPTLEHAKRGVANGTIGVEQYLRIRRAFQAKRLPPQDTPLGGHIGIHGVGKGDARVHEDFNWTNGCIALTNAQMDDLARWVRVGTPVVIR